MRSPFLTYPVYQPWRRLQLLAMGRWHAGFQASAWCALVILLLKRQGQKMFCTALALILARSAM